MKESREWCNEKYCSVWKVFAVSLAMEERTLRAWANKICTNQDITKSHRLGGKESREGFRADFKRVYRNSFKVIEKPFFNSSFVDVRNRFRCQLVFGGRKIWTGKIPISYRHPVHIVTDNFLIGRNNSPLFRAGSHNFFSKIKFKIAGVQIHCAIYLFSIYTF